MRMKQLAIFLILSILFLGCSAPPSEKTTPPKITPTTPTPTATPIPTPPSIESELGIEDIQKELEELEKLLSELQELENITFEI